MTPRPSEGQTLDTAAFIKHRKKKNTERVILSLQEKISEYKWLIFLTHLL